MWVKPSVLIIGLVLWGFLQILACCIHILETGHPSRPGESSGRVPLAERRPSRVLLEQAGDASLPPSGPSERPVLRDVEIDRQVVILGVASNHLVDL
jgi:hypothetical protein